MDLKESLQKYYYFTEQDWKYTMQYYVPDHLKAKNYFLKLGKISNKVAYIKSGTLRAFFFNDKGEEVTTNFFKQDHVVISIWSFNNQKPSKESIIAIEDCELLSITYENMKKLIKLVPKWQRITQDVDSLKYSRMHKRTIEFQTLSASERYKQFIENNPEILQRVALKHIASYLGIDIATLSRIRHKI